MPRLHALVPGSKGGTRLSQHTSAWLCIYSVLLLVRRSILIEAKVTLLSSSHSFLSNFLRSLNHSYLQKLTNHDL